MSIYIDDEVTTKKNLFAKLGIGANGVPQTREKRFRFPSRIDQDGNHRHLKRFICNEFSVYVPAENREVRVRIANSQKLDADGNFIYFPTDNALEAGEKGEIVVSDDMAFLWWFINPVNRQSPFRKEGGAVFYEFLDNDNIAKVSNDIDEQRIEAMSIILGRTAWSNKKLRMLAKGMGISGVEDMTDEVVKSKLKERAFKNPGDFINQAESREVQFTGKIQEAIDRHILQLTSMNGMQRWYLNGKEIIPVTHGIDPRKLLEDHLSSKWFMYADEINDALEGTTKASNLNQAENDEYFEKPETIQSTSEADFDLWNAYLEMKKDEPKYLKIKKLAETDRESAGTHFKTREAIDRYAGEIDVYKKGLEIEANGGVEAEG